MSQYILALDQGTTSSRALPFRPAGAGSSAGRRRSSRSSSRNPAGWSTTRWKSGRRRRAWRPRPPRRPRQNGRSIAALGITNQRETVVVWHRATGQPIYNAIRVAGPPHSRLLRRAARRGPHEPLIRAKTGLLPDPYFSASKVKWILDHVPDARRQAAAGQLAFGTVDSWLIWNLTQGELHVTDVTNASRTMLFNIHTLAWDDELLALFDVPRSMLPAVRPSSAVYGETKTTLFAAKIPIAGIAGDQQAALFGQLCTAPGMVKSTYGTGCFLLMNIGPKPALSQHNLLTTIAWQIGDEVQYALEGSIFMAGAVVQWLRDNLGLVKTAADVEALARQVADSGGVTFVPAFAGLGAPYWDAHARGTVFGLSRATTAAHVARAALDAIAYQTLDVLQAMQADAALPIAELRVDGGATANKLLLQLLADVLDTKVVRPRMAEATALGAAYLAGLAVGYWPNIEAIQALARAADAAYFPAPDRADRAAGVADWLRAVRALRVWSAPVSTASAAIKTRN